MRVLIINTSENIGGAAIAANRLMEALKNNGVKAKMLVRDKRTDQITVASLPQSPLLKAKFVWERVCIWKANRFKKHNLFQVDLANTGTDITPLPGIQRSRCHPPALGKPRLPFPERHTPHHRQRQTDRVDDARPMAVYRHLPLQWGVHEIPNRVPPLPPASARRRHA